MSRPHSASLLALVLLLIPGVSTAGPAIALDIGHSSASPGTTTARGRGQFYFNRDLAGHLASALQAQQFDVRLINWDGSDTGLESRSAQAKGADLLISVHHDSVQPRYLQAWTVKDHGERYSDRFSGFSLFVSRQNPNPALSVACAFAIGSALRDSGFRPSLHHAEPIAGENRSLADEANGVYYYDELTATQLAIQLEAGVLVNRDEERVLMRIDIQQRMVQSGDTGPHPGLRPGGKPLEKEPKTQQSQRN